jgi:hypothetical protein
MKRDFLVYHVPWQDMAGMRDKIIHGYNSGSLDTHIAIMVVAVSFTYIVTQTLYRHRSRGAMAGGAWSLPNTGCKAQNEI